MRTQATHTRRAGSIWLRAILLILAVGLTINLVVQIRKIWNRANAKPGAVESAEAPDTATTNAPTASVSSNSLPAKPAAVPAMQSDEAPKLVALAPPGAPEPPPAPLKKSEGGGSASSPPGFGRIGFPPGVAPVVLYQPGTLTFVAIPVDADDLTNRVDIGTNRVDRATQRNAR